jgi:hypothetical protein
LKFIAPKILGSQRTYLQTRKIKEKDHYKPGYSHSNKDDSTKNIKQSIKEPFAEYSF